MENKATARFSIIYVTALFYLVAGGILRAGLWSVFGREAGLGARQLLAALGVGFVSDVAALVYIVAPFIIFLALVPERIYQARLHRALVAAALFVTLYGLIYLCAVEYFFFEEFDARFNLVAVDYLLYPHEVFINLWESYPIVWFLIGTLAVTAVLFAVLWRYAGRRLTEPSDYAGRLKVLALHLIALLVMIFAFSSDRISYSLNRVEDEIAANGISSFFQALRTSDLKYDLYYRTLAEARAFKLMRGELQKGGGRFVSDNLQNLNRRIEGGPGGLGRMNVVVVTVESLGAEYVGATGSTRGLTPEIDQLAGEALFFKNTYATGTRTVRGLEAIIASFPPIPSESILKRPGSENIATWGHVMRAQGYDTSFLYGGFGLFDNMNYFFGNNGFNLSDRTDIKNIKFANIWGVCDEDLFDHALGYYDNLQKGGKEPFFSLIMTTSNHKPFTFPPGISGVPESGGGRDAGVRYSDYAIARFIRQAQGHPWFSNTLFVIVADHDARVYGREQIPLERYRIPLIMYAPGKLEPRVIEKNVSQMDIAPTVLGLLGLPYTAPFYGRDVLAPNAAESALLVNHNHDVALYRGGKLVVLGLQKDLRGYSYDPLTKSQTAWAPSRSLANLTTAYYQTAYKLFAHQAYRCEQ